MQKCKNAKMQKCKNAKMEKKKNAKCKKALNIPCIIVYELYRLPNVYLAPMLINLRMRFKQIAFVLKRIVPLG